MCNVLLSCISIRRLLQAQNQYEQKTDPEYAANKWYVYIVPASFMFCIEWIYIENWLNKKKMDISIENGWHILYGYH